ncbi:hypothetical protein LDENG_00156230, partial [Lucifuga dentata]
FKEKKNKKRLYGETFHSVIIPLSAFIKVRFHPFYPHFWVGVLHSLLAREELHVYSFVSRYVRSFLLAE